MYDSEYRYENTGILMAQSNVYRATELVAGSFQIQSITQMPIAALRISVKCMNSIMRFNTQFRERKRGVHLSLSLLLARVRQFTFFSTYRYINRVDLSRDSNVQREKFREKGGKEEPGI